MRNNKINYFVVGSFMLASLLAFVVSVSLLTGRTGATEEYFTSYENVAGLKFGTKVLYEGYQVGQVEEIIPAEQAGHLEFRIRLSITKDWRIPTDSVATIAASGLLAAATISIHAGSSNERLKPGQQIISRERVDVFASLSEVASKIGDLSDNSIKPLLENLGRSVGGIGDIVESDGQLFVQRLRELVEQLTEKTPEITNNLASFSAKLDQGGNKINELLSNVNAKRLNNTISNAESFSSDLAQVSRELHGTREEFHRLLASVQELVDENRPYLDQSATNLNHVMESLAEHIDAINHNLDNTSRNLLEFSHEIRSNPGLLLGGRSPRDEAND